MLRLNLGCSDAHIAGFTNVDRAAPADQITDLRLTWPWEDSSVDYIRAWDIIEHLPDKIHTMNEIHRVLKPGGTVEIVVPTTDGRGADQDPTHCSYWNRNSFFYHEAGNPHLERFKDAYGMHGGFRVVSEKQETLADNVVKLAIVLQAVKASGEPITAPVSASEGDTIPALTSPAGHRERGQSARGALSKLLSKVSLAVVVSCLIYILCPVRIAALQADAATSGRNVVSILRREGVTVFAGVGIPQRTALDINDVSDWFKMSGVDSMPNSAKVIQLQTDRDGADGYLVSDNVRLFHALPVIALAIPSLADIASPEPAGIGFIDIAPESFGNKETTNERSTNLSNSYLRRNAFSDSRRKPLVSDNATRVTRPFGNAFEFAKCLDGLNGFSLTQQHNYYFIASGVAK